MQLLVAMAMAVRSYTAPAVAVNTHDDSGYGLVSIMCHDHLHLLHTPQTVCGRHSSAQLSTCSLELGIHQVSYISSLHLTS
jgi:hypothetical protein